MLYFDRGKRTNRDRLIASSDDWPEGALAFYSVKDRNVLRKVNGYEGAPDVLDVADQSDEVIEWVNDITADDVRLEELDRMIDDLDEPTQ